MLYKQSSNLSKSAKAFQITVLIFLFTRFQSVFGVPINFVNNNNYNENYANRPLPHQPPQQWQFSNQAPEMEDFGPLHMNRNQFRRHVVVSPADAKMSPGGAFQKHASEQFGWTGDSFGAGTNFRPFDDSSYYQQQTNNIFRHQQQPYFQGQEDEEQDFLQRPNDQSNNRYYRRNTQNMQPPSPNFSSRFKNPHHREEPYIHHDNHAQNLHYHQQMLNDNEIYRERNVYSQAPHDEWERANTAPPREERPPVVGQWQQDEQHLHYQNNKVPTTPSANAFVEFPGQNPTRFGKPNMVPSLSSSAIPKPPTAVAIIVPGVGGNSTLFIEYDVSDNDVTYETVMEVEDVPDSLVHTNRVVTL